MRAIVLEGFGGPEVMVPGEVPTPVASDGQVLIRVHATSVNRPDIVQREGNYPPPPGDSELLGLEVAGVVETIGPGIEGLSPGDRVVALVGGGGYAEFAVAYEGHCIKLPQSVDFVAAACLCETYITAWLNLFRLGELKNGESALLHGGGGGVNTAAIQLCKALVPDSQLFVTASPTKIERVRELGVDHVIDYTATAFDDEIRQITGKRGVNVILDHIGADYLAGNMKSLAVEGRLVVIGVTSGIKAELNLALMMVKRQRILGSVLRSRPVAEKTDIISEFASVVVPLLENGKVAPLVNTVFPLSKAKEAHELMEKSQHFGKIVLDLEVVS